MNGLSNGEREDYFGRWVVGGQSLFWPPGWTKRWWMKAGRVVTDTTEVGQTPAIEPSDIISLIEILKASEWQEAYLRYQDFELHLSSRNERDKGSEGSVSSISTRQAVTDHSQSISPREAIENGAGVEAEHDGSEFLDESKYVVIRAESLGVFWRAPQPGAPPFVEVGDAVNDDTPLAIVEVMKMFTRLTPGCRGVVSAIHVENGDTVEYGQALISIDPDQG